MTTARRPEAQRKGSAPTFVREGVNREAVRPRREKKKGKLLSPGAPVSGRGKDVLFESGEDGFMDQ